MSIIYGLSEFLWIDWNDSIRMGLIMRFRDKSFDTEENVLGLGN